jgi:hypothetical protein
MVNYQPVGPRPVFRGELKEAFFASVPRIHASRSLGVAVQSWRLGPIIFREYADFQCTLWHVETVMKKVAVVLGNSKKPLP